MLRGHLLDSVPKNRAFVVSAGDGVKTDRINSRHGPPLSSLNSASAGVRKYPLELTNPLPLGAYCTTMAPHCGEKAEPFRVGISCIGQTFLPTRQTRLAEHSKPSRENRRIL
jgi:hypothetical protein